MTTKTKTKTMRGVGVHAAMLAWSDAIAALERHRTCCRLDAVLDLQQEAWEAAMEAQLTPAQRDEWEAACLDVTYGECGPVRTRAIGLEVLRS
jgi:hypothetical protein